MAPRKNQKKQAWKKKLFIEIRALLILFITILAILGEIGLSMMAGDFLVFVYKYLFGYIRYIIYFLLLYVYWRRFRGQVKYQMNSLLLGWVLILISLMVIITAPAYQMIPSFSFAWEQWSKSIFFQSPNNLFNGGGVIGLVIFWFIHVFIGNIATIFSMVVLLSIGISLIIRKTIYEIIQKPVESVERKVNETYDYFREQKKLKKEKKIADLAESFDNENPMDFYIEYDEDKGGEIYEYTGVFDEQIFNISDNSMRDNESMTHEHFFDVEEMSAIENINTPDEEPIEESKIIFPDMIDNITDDHVPQQSSYIIPSLSFLHTNNNKKQQKDKNNIYVQMNTLQKTLDSFNVKAQVTNANIGPAITQYEVVLEPGVKVSRIAGMSDDIALAMAAKGVRIEAPIPGKSAVGIEIPNDEVQMVTLKEVLIKNNGDKSQKLLVGLGRSITGEEIEVELNKMPHLLVAGSTGSGKSVCINTIIMSVLFRSTPDEVKFLMIDPKKVELNGYNDIPHLLAPVVTHPKKAAIALKKVVAIMDDRYELFAQSGVKNLDGYNQYAEMNQLEKMPYIVVIIDELADLMVVAAKEVEESIMRLAQMARAAGIHMIVATQRPSVDVITGVIKSNIPSRIAFAVSSQIDSRTILDMGGAERLVGRGDMLYLAAGASKPQRIQGAFVSEQEVEKVVDFIKKQAIEKEKITTQIFEHELNHLSENNLENDEENQFEDELFKEAIQFAIMSEVISASKLQRRFRIGYNRAARMIDDMDEHGILGPPTGNKGRPVLIQDISQIPKNNKEE